MYTLIKSLRGMVLQMALKYAYLFNEKNIKTI